MGKLPTPRQDLLIQLLVENYGKARGKRRPIGSLMLEAGFSPETAKNPKKILAAQVVQEAVGNIVDILEAKRDLVIKHGLTEKKMKSLNAYTSSLTIDILTKNIQLLRGRATHHLAVQVGLDDESKQKLLALMGK